MTDSPPRPRPRTALWVVVGVLVVLVIPVVLVFAVFPLILGQTFDSADDIAPENVRQLRVFVLNRAELDGGADVGPYHAAPADFAALLAPLRSTPEVDQYPDARGPWLGEYRVLLTNGRKGTIKFYWSRPPGGWKGVAPFTALSGEAAAIAAHAGGQMPTAALRFQIGRHKFEGGSVAALIRATEAGAVHGTKAK